MIVFRLLSNNQKFSLNILDFVQDENGDYFRITSSENAAISIKIEYKLKLDKTYQTVDFDCIPFNSPTFYKENDIFETHVTDMGVGRIGWIFPVQALVSKEHSFSNNEHFLKYAFVSICKLLKGEFFYSDIIIENTALSFDISLTDIYPSNIIILCLSKAKTRNIVDFTVNNYLHSLYSFNYFLALRPEEGLTGNFPKFEGSTFSKIKMSSLSYHVKDDIYIKSLYGSLLRNANHPLVEFHLFYQIIELLIDRVYTNEIRRIAAYPRLNGKPARELSKELEGVTKEDMRIKKLFSLYLSDNISNREILLNAANVILIPLNKKQENVEEAIYQVRNIIVHNYRSITNIDPDYKNLIAFNKGFVKLIGEVLSYYEEPDNLYPEAPIQWLEYKLQSELKK